MDFISKTTTGEITIDATQTTINGEYLKMDLKKEYGTNRKSEVDGVWEDFGGGTTVLIARIGNENYQKVFRRISKPYQNAIRRGTLGNDKAEDLLIQAMADCIVLDWKGLKEDDKPVKFSKEECVRVLKEYKDFRDHVSELANSMEIFRQEMDSEAEKNSKKP